VSRESGLLFAKGTGRMTLSGKGILRLLVAAFLIYYIWRDPSGAGSAIGRFLDGTGNIIEEIFTRFADFLKSLGIGDNTTTPTTPTTAG
jgi:hypothetical protein